MCSHKQSQAAVRANPLVFLCIQPPLLPLPMKGAALLSGRQKPFICFKMEKKTNVTKCRQIWSTVFY